MHLYGRYSLPLCLLGLAAGFSILTSCDRANAPFRHPAGIVFDGSRLWGASPLYLERLFPGERVAVQENSDLSNLVYIGRYRFARPGLGHDYDHSANVSMEITNYLNFHDIREIPASNLRFLRPFEETNRIITFTNNLTYTTIRHKKRNGSRFALPLTPFHSGWRRAALRIRAAIRRFRRQRPMSLPTFFIKDLTSGNMMQYTPVIKMFGASMLKTMTMMGIYDYVERMARQIEQMRTRKRRDQQRIAQLRSRLPELGKEAQKKTRMEIARLERDIAGIPARIRDRESRSATYRSLVKPMIIRGENGPYAYFRSRVGDEFFARFLSNLDIRHTPWTFFDRNTTARDLAYMFERIAKKDLLRDPHLAWRAMRMHGLTGRKGMGEFLPTCVKVFQKRGIRWHYDYQARHDAGIIMFGDRPLVLSMVSCGYPLDYSFPHEAEQLAGHVARILYEECYQPRRNDSHATAPQRVSRPRQQSPSPTRANSRARRLRLLTYNIWGELNLHQQRIPALLQEIRRSNADLIALQEATEWFVEELLRQPWVRDRYRRASIPLDHAQRGGVYLLSRFPLQDVRFHPLPSRLQRGLLVAKLHINNRPLQVATLHLESFFKAGYLRAQQLTNVFSRLEQGPDVILMGDFNFGDGEQPESASLDRKYQDLWRILKRHNRPGFTWNIRRNPAARKNSFKDEGSRRLDRILIRSRYWKPVSIRLVGTQPFRTRGKRIYPSDHFGVLAVLEADRRAAPLAAHSRYRNPG